MPRRGGTLIFSYMRELGHFLGLKILYFNIIIFFFGFQKKINFLDYEEFVDIFLGSRQIWTILRGRFYAF